jgi:hypothetical protein
MKNFSVLIAFLFIMVSCSKDDGPTSDNNNSLIDPADSDALSAVIIMPAGSTSSNGNPPAPSGSNQAPIVDSQQEFVTSSNGSTAPLNFGYENVNGNIDGCYVQIDGAGNYFTIPYGSNTGESGSLQLPLGIPSNVDQGEFNVNFCVYDNNGLVSNIISINVSVLRLGTGALQISLTWDTPTDQDLYVTDPNGEEISYQSQTSTSGGLLDRDDLDGFGPENIFWSDDAPDGEYSVSVNDYDETSTPNTFYITVSGPNNQSRSFSGTTQNGSTVNVTTFTKNGDELTF